MPRLKQFKFRWCNAFFTCNFGYRAILNIGINDTSIDCLVDGKPFEIHLINVDDFIENLKICNLKEWNQKYYENAFVVDGFDWNLVVEYDNIFIVSAGSNGYPKEFKRFISLLHDKYKLPFAKIDSQVCFKKALKNTDIIHYDNPNFYF